MKSLWEQFKAEGKRNFDEVYQGSTQKKVILILFTGIGIIAFLYGFFSDWWSESDPSSEPSAEAADVQSTKQGVGREFRRVTKEPPKFVFEKVPGQVDPPKEVFAVAARYHWVSMVTGPDVDPAAVISELHRISSLEGHRRDLYIEDGRILDFEEEVGKWERVTVFPVRQITDRAWEMNTVAVIDSEEYWLFERVEQGEDGTWRITEVSSLPLP